MERADLGNPFEFWSAVRFAGLLVLYSLMVLFAMFNLTWVAQSLGNGRYLAFSILVLVPAAYATASRPMPRLATLALALLLLPQIHWTMLYVLGRQQTGGNPTIPLNAYIARNYRSGTPTLTDRGLLIAPPGYEEPAGRQE